MPKQPPVYWPYEPTDEERAVIAGYLLHHRAGTLKALASLGEVGAGVNSGQFDAMYKFYQHAEAYSRFLLYWIGYPVAKDEMYVSTP